MKTKDKIFLGSFIGTLFLTLVSSSYFYVVFRKAIKKLRKGFEKWDDIKKF